MTSGADRCPFGYHNSNHIVTMSESNKPNPVLTLVTVMSFALVDAWRKLQADTKAKIKLIDSASTQETAKLNLVDDIPLAEDIYDKEFCSRYCDYLHFMWDEYGITKPSLAGLTPLSVDRKTSTESGNILSADFAFNPNDYALWRETQDEINKDAKSESGQRHMKAKIISCYGKDMVEVVSRSIKVTSKGVSGTDSWKIESPTSVNALAANGNARLAQLCSE